MNGNENCSYANITTTSIWQKTEPASRTYDSLARKQSLEQYCEFLNEIQCELSALPHHLHRATLEGSTPM